MRKVSHGRVGPPVFSPGGSLYALVRQVLAQHGGAASRIQIAEALRSSSAAAVRLGRVGGIGVLLNNMRHSGEVTIDGDEVRATPRALRRLSERQEKNP